MIPDIGNTKAQYVLMRGDPFLLLTVGEQLSAHLRGLVALIDSSPRRDNEKQQEDRFLEPSHGDAFLMR